MGERKSAEGILVGLDPDEGPNMNDRLGAWNFDGEGETDKYGWEARTHRGR